MVNMTSKNKVTLLNHLLPIKTIPLWIAMAILLPMSTYSVSQIKYSIITWFDSLLTTFKPENFDSNFNLPSIPIHFLLIAVFGFLSCFIIFTAIQSIYIKNWFLSVDKKEYYYPQPALKTFFSILNWSIYRFFYVFHPVIAMAILSFLLLLASINFFNIIAFVMGLNLHLVLILGIFISGCIFFFWVVSVIMSVWYLVTTAYGNTVSVIEPFTKIDLIRKRSRRLSFLSFGVIFTYIFYLLLIVAIFAEISILMIHNYHFSFKDFILYSLGFVITAGVYVLIGRSLTLSYYKSILIQYAKIALKKNSITHAQHQPFDLDKSNYSSTTL